MMKPIGVTLTASYVVLIHSSCISYQISELIIYLSMTLLFVFLYCTVDLPLKRTIWPVNYCFSKLER